MDKKQAFLAGLAQLPNEPSKQVLESEFDTIGALLDSENNYAICENQIEFLLSISNSDSARAIQMFRDFLVRLETINFHNDEDSGIPDDWFMEYYTPSKMMVKVLESIRFIRYLQIEKSFETFWEYSLHANSEVQKSALKGLEKLSEYNLDAVNQIKFEAQEVVVGLLEQRCQDEKCLTHFEAIMQICECLFSPSMSGQSSDWQTIRIKTTQAPVDYTRQFRDRALTILENLYGHASASVEKMYRIITVIDSATHPHTRGSTDAFRGMLESYIVRVLQFMRTVVHEAPFPIKQKIEHHAYWHMRRNDNDLIDENVIQIKDLLFEDADYMIYRYLIGYESEFGEWSRDHRHDFKLIDEERKSKAFEYAESINEKNFVKWQVLLNRFVEVESNDHATFPFFSIFLERLAEHEPQLALNLFNQNAGGYLRFLVAILSGLWKGDETLARTTVNSWLDQGTYLSHIAGMLSVNRLLDEDYLGQLFQRAVELKDTTAVRQVLLAVVTNYDHDVHHLIKSIVIPALRELTSMSDASWVSYVWFKDEKDILIDDLGEDGRHVTLENLLMLDDIDYHAESVLNSIAKHDIANVIDFFEKRIFAEEDEKTPNRFKAFPFKFQILHKTLSNNPGLMIEKVRTWHGTKGDWYMHQSGRFVYIVFSNMTDELVKELNSIVQTGEKKEVEFVLGILRNYDGIPSIHSLCQAIVDLLPEDDELLNLVKSAISNTGVTSGEYGPAEAQEARSGYMKRWLEDDRKKVVKFAASFKKEIDDHASRLRSYAEEQIELRKHQFGDDEQ
jgi:hypothetical protein